MNRFVSRIPTRTIAYLVATWIFLAVLNFILRRAGIYRDVPMWFPISVFRGLTIHISGIPYLFIFSVGLAFAVRYAPKLTLYHVWLIGFLLILFGNLGQGGWDEALRKPFYASGTQYYSDALKITSWHDWLRSYNVHQPTLLPHTKTHPAFAVLIHYLVLQVSANSLDALGIVIVLISSLSILLVWHIFKRLGVSRENRNLLAILFSILPAVNIYSAVSLDGIILTAATLFLLGAVMLLTSARLPAGGLIAVACGLIMTNLLSFGGIFLVAAGGMLAVGEVMVTRRFRVTVSLLASIGLLIAVIIFLSSMYGYHHFQAFFTASAIENPDGFRGWHEPLTYLATRVECISEIALFLSFGFLAMLFHPDKLAISFSDWQSIDMGLLLSGVITLLAMFTIGAFHTGETARSALFIYPYIMLALRNADPATLRDIVKCAGFQTMVMQLFGGYYW